MYKKYLYTVIFFCNLLIFTSVIGQVKTLYPDIPRIDVHAHIGDSLQVMESYMAMRDKLLQQLDVDLALWINLGVRGQGLDNLEEAEKLFKGRFLPCIHDYFIGDGLNYSPEQLSEWVSKGVVGYKIWAKSRTGSIHPEIELPMYQIDHPANDPTFFKMEQLGLVGAAIDISSPSYPGSPYGPFDPTRFWRQIKTWERVLDRHPNIKVVNSHMMFLLGSEEQLHYLAYMLETYPNLYVDLAATFQFFYLLESELLREFMIKYSDRLLFGTDIGNHHRREDIVKLYSNCFQILETDKIVSGSFHSSRKIQGLHLPRDVLEKIYYKNAMHIYPRVEITMRKLGYEIE
jgi:predicted TIM-barrel fold metal-dependent hydrolase